MATFTCCECHKTLDTQTSGGTGYAIRNGDLSIPEELRRVCYECCAEDDRAWMRKHGATVLYLSKDTFGWKLTNWPGTLLFKVRGVSVKPYSGGFGCQRTDAWFIFEGYVWHAINRGDMQIARCKRTKERFPQP